MIDSHAHLDFLEFDADRDAVVKRAHDAHITKILSLAGTDDLAAIEKTYKILGSYEGMYSSAGIHPHRASSFSPESISKIRQIVAHPRFVAIGEIGLDFHYESSSREDQMRAFRAQVELALELKLPVILHIRDAFREAYDLCTSYNNHNLRGVVHCFTGNLDDAKMFLDIDFYISFSGILTFKKTDELKNACREVPLDRILVETDSPYLAPVPFRGKRNEPAYVKYVAEEVARIKNKSLKEIDAATEENTIRLFGMS